MTLDPETRAAIHAVAQQLARQEAEIASLRRAQRGPQLAYSSLEEGQSVEARDETGATRGRFGWQPDGTVAIVTEGGDPPSAPSAPTVTPSLGGLRITWDGTLDNDVALPADFDHMAVHVSTSSGFTPSAATYVGGIRRAGDGGMLPVVPLPYQVHYVVLVPVTTGGIQGAPSAEASATPLQVDAPDITAGSIEAVHIAAGAVEADKLEAVLVLATTILAGTPGAARVELDSGGIRGYDSGGALIFTIDSAGNALFSGDITGSEISGSRMVVGAAPDATGVIEQDGTDVEATMTAANGARAQLRAGSTQAEFSAFSDSADPTTPAAGFAAQATEVAFVLNSDNSDSTAPGVQGSANASQAVLWLRSQRGSSVEPRVEMAATSTLAAAEWSAGTASRVRIDATATTAALGMRPEEPAGSAPEASDGALYAFRASSDDTALVSLQCPLVSTGAGAERRSILHIEAPNDTARPYAGVSLFANRVRFRNDVISSVVQTDEGLVQVADTHTVRADRHAPVTSALVSNPGFGSTGTFVDFSAGEFPPLDFRTSWSGRTRVTVKMAGINNNSAASSIALGFRLSGGSTVAAALDRCAYVRSDVAGSSGSQQDCVPFTLQLAGLADYTLTPAWRISSGSSATASFDTVLGSFITVEPLM